KIINQVKFFQQYPHPASPLGFPFLFDYQQAYQPPDQYFYKPYQKGKSLRTFQEFPNDHPSSKTHQAQPQMQSAQLPGQAQELQLWLEQPQYQSQSKQFHDIYYSI